MVLKYPYATEKATTAVDEKSQLQFIVDNRASKADIKRAIEKTFGKEVTAVNTMMTTKGRKKATISFADNKAAEEIMSRLGIM
ncbi:MAG: 50S ribosomal protein L23 [Methanospirillaceae archaeon]|nr:50S ribosomal protein L23 [Methanospirillaceae archaeon]